MLITNRTPEEIDALINQCIESEETGVSKYPGMTYEQGIRVAIEWLDGSEGHPFE